MKHTIIAIVMGLGLNAAQAHEPLTLKIQDDLIETVEIERVLGAETFDFDIFSGWESDCTALKRKPQNEGDLSAMGRSFDGLDPADIINIGEQVWKIIKDNEPILEARSMKASALPRGIECWDELSAWAVPRAETYKVTYKNLYGMAVVDLRFRLLYTYGGQLMGQGQYLTNSTIQYSNIDVMWGYIFNADVEIPQVINMGTREAPLAGMQLTLNWNIRTRPLSVKKSLSSVSFFVAGDGRPTQQLD